LQVIKKLSADGTMTTVAGCTPSYPLRSDCISNGTTGTRTYLDGPLSLGVDNSGSVLIIDPALSHIRELLTDGSIINIAGNGEYQFSGDGGPAKSAQLGPPEGIAVDAAGNLFIADYYNARVRKVSAEGTITTVAGNGDQIYPPAYSGDGGPATSAQLSEPVAVAVDGASNLFIATLHGWVKKVSSDGIITTVAGGGSISGFDSPGFTEGGPAIGAALLYMSAAVADDSGNLFIGEYNLSSHPPGEQVGRIVKLSTDGTIRTGIVTDGLVLSLALDDERNLFFAEGNPGYWSRVRRLSPDGSIVTVAGSGTFGFSGDGGPARDAQVAASGVAVDGAGNLFIAELRNNRIRKVSPDGIITTIAGNGIRGYAGDGGPATDASISDPHGIAVDRDGNVYFTDANSAIRVLHPSDRSIGGR
jgi:NHL repeat-containing protein